MTQTANKQKVLQIPDYQIEAKIGQGGVARIYKARQKSLDRDVAIKVLSHELSRDSDIVRRFDRESKTIAGLTHPNIVHIIDRGKIDDQYYFVMEYIDGTSFKEVLYSKDYTVRQKLEMIVMILKGLDYAHKNGVIHRDVKPANILVDKQGNAMMADFGIAQILSKPEQEVTRSDVIMGTLAYMSPEQRVSSTNVDLTTDIFSTGVIIYEVLIGKRPMGRFKLPSEINPKIPQKFDEIINKCMAMSAKDRFQSAVELKDAILNQISSQGGQNVPGQNGMSSVQSFIGNSQYLDTIKETKHGTTMLMENLESRELFIIKKNDKQSTGLKEARQLAQLKHDNILEIYGAGGDKNKLVVVMEYAQGGSLKDRMIKPYEVEKALEIVRQISEALQFAHNNGVIHGNLRPSNVLFTKDNVIKLCDFGLPPHYDLMKKNWYAPPEKRVSKQADIYGLGVILHKLLYNRNPSYDRNGYLMISRGNDLVPGKLVDILKKLLAFKIANRYQDFEEYFADLELMKRKFKRKKKPDVELNDSIRFNLQSPVIKIVAAVGVVLFFIFMFLYFGDIIK
ncbi:MAG: serine/threonine protein kinase [candidate division Zixibacteria bacterium]|nr:serine/threonine protein kinase [candidate division Zixibacteria bacterium]